VAAAIPGSMLLVHSALLRLLAVSAPLFGCPSVLLLPPFCSSPRSALPLARLFVLVVFASLDYVCWVT
jgi:hypothetical protein